LRQLIAQIHAMKIPARFRKNRPFLATRIQSSWLPVMLTLTALSQTPLSAQSQWTTTSGNWNSEFNWNPVLIPVSDPATHLVFQASSGNYTTTNDIGADTFILNRITVVNTGAGTVTIAGASTANTLTFAGDNPTLDITGTTLFTGLMAGAPTITKTGPGTFIHDSNNGGFTGTLIINQGTFVNRSTTVDVTNFNPVSIVVNNGGTYQFGAATAGNPNVPNSTFITVNTGGLVNWQESEDFGGFHLQGGTINLQQGNANTKGSSPQIWTNGTLTGGSFLIGDSNPINKTTPGTVFITGNVAISNTGGLNIIEGTISLASAANLGIANVFLGDSGGATAGTLLYNGATASRVGEFTINPGGGTIDVASATTILTLTGAISGNGTLNKVGPGQLRLAGSLGSSGTTNIAAGILQVEPVSAFGNFVVAASTALAVNSGIGATSFMPTSVNLADGATLQFDLNTNTLPAAPLAVIGDFDGLIRAGTPTLRLTNLQPFADGFYPLVDYTGSPITSGFNLALPGRTLGNLIYDTDNTQIGVSITGTDTVKWKGGINDIWDAGTAAGVGGTNNWQLVAAGGATNFIDTDTVTFDDTATLNAVNLTAAVQPFSTVVNAAGNYTFSGPGKISGSTGLVKSGTGTLAVATDNDYIGGTTVLGGTLQIGNGGTTGSLVGTVTLNGGALAFNRSDNFSFNNTIVVGTSAALIQNGSGTATVSTPLVATTNTVDFGGSGNLIMGATVSGNGILNKNDSGTLTLLANNNTFTGTLNVNAGTVLLDDLGAGGDLGAASVVVNNGGTFIFGPNGNVDFPDTTLVTINTGGLFRIEQGENYGGVILNGGELRFVSTARTGVNSTGVGVLNIPTIVHDLRSGAITADITLPGTGGALNQTNGGILAKTTTGTVTIGPGVTFQNTLALQIKEGTLAMGIGSVPAGGAAAITLGDVGTPATLQLNGAGLRVTTRPFILEAGGGFFDLTDAGSSLIVSGIVSGPGPLIKDGSGTLTLSTANDYFGDTAINEGTLEVTNVFGSATGSGTVIAEGTLAGDGGIITADGKSVFIEGTFRPGVAGALQGADFSLATGVGGSTVFGVGSVSWFDLFTAGGDQTANPAAADLLRVAGDFQITPGATLVLSNPNNLTFQDGDVFRLFDWSGLGMLSGAWSIDATALNLGDLTLDTSDLYTAGTLAITIPEPGSALLMMLGFTTFALRRRRAAFATHNRSSTASLERSI
jgi:autotransporter-associated beta strand protein